MNFYTTYFSAIAACISSTEENIQSLASATQLLHETQKHGGKVILVGNGGSAAIASHVAVDLTKVAGVRAVNFNEADLITCLANDYGYEKWVAQALEFYADSNDLIVLISSSGKSPNIVNGAIKAKQMKLSLITFSGFDPDNPLRNLGDLNFWADSQAYNIIEMTHHVWLLALVDKLAVDRKGNT